MQQAIRLLVTSVVTGLLSPVASWRLVPFNSLAVGLANKWFSALVPTPIGEQPRKRKTNL